MNEQGCIKLGYFCTTNKTTNKLKRQPIKWYEVFINHKPDKGLIAKISKELIQFNNKTKQDQKPNPNNLTKIMDRGCVQTLFQKRPIDGQQVYEKVFSILIIREMKTKATMRCDLAGQNGCHQKDKQ